MGFPTQHLSKDFKQSSKVAGLVVETTVEQEHQKIQNAHADHANLTGAGEFAARGSINVTGAKLEAEKKKKDAAARLINANLTQPELKAIGALNDKIKGIEDSIKKDEENIRALENKKTTIASIRDKAKAGTLDQNDVDGQKKAATVGIVIKDRTNENIISQADMLEKVNQDKIDELKKGVSDKRAEIAELRADIKAIKENAANDNHEANKAIFEKHGLNAEGIPPQQAIKEVYKAARVANTELGSFEDQIAEMDTYEQVVFYTQKLKDHKVDSTQVTAQEMNEYKELLSDEAIKILETSEDAKAVLNGDLKVEPITQNKLEISLPGNNAM